jgi:hypothetical protein
MPSTKVIVLLTLKHCPYAVLKITVKPWFPLAATVHSKGLDITITIISEMSIENTTESPLKI